MEHRDQATHKSSRHSMNMAHALILEINNYLGLCCWKYSYNYFLKYFLY